MLRLEAEYSINVKYFYFLILRAFIYVETRACTFNINRETRWGDDMWNANKRNDSFSMRGSFSTMCDL